MYFVSTNICRNQNKCDASSRSGSEELRVLTHACSFLHTVLALSLTELRDSDSSSVPQSQTAKIVPETTIFNPSIKQSRRDRCFGHVTPNSVPLTGRSINPSPDSHPLPDNHSVKPTIEQTQRLADERIILKHKFSVRS